MTKFLHVLLDLSSFSLSVQVIEKFYDIRKASLYESFEMSLHDKCASLLDDPIESWTFNDPSTSEYVVSF